MVSVKYMMQTPPTACLAVLLLVALVVSPAHTTPCPARCNSCVNHVVNCTDLFLIGPPRVYPPGTKELDLSRNSIRMLGMRTFSNLSSLEVLKIPNNNIVSIRNDAFRSFPNLQTLDLTGNRIYRIFRRSLRHLSRLRTLTLNKNRIQRLQRIFDFVPHLFQLNLAHNKLRYIGDQDLATLEQVTNIDLQDNHITRIHKDAFKNLHALRYLFLGRNPLTTLPALTWGSRVLQMLDFSSCNLTAVPQPLPASVADLRLSNNKITQIQHTDFINITALKMLALDENQLQFLADGTFSHLTELEEVWLRDNRLVYIPRDLPDNLRRLNMDSNSLQQIEADVFSPNSRLDYLTVQGNRLSRLAARTFTGLRFLNTLNFQGNIIQVIESRALSDLGGLSTLLLSDNPLQRIENEAFHQLNNLSSLHMAHLTEEDFQLEYNFLPQMLRLKTLILMNSPSLAESLLTYVNNPQTSRDIMRYVTMLDLSYNDIDYLAPRLLVVFPALTSAILEGNNFHCTHRLRWVGDWMRRATNVTFGYYEEAVCTRPSRLRGQNVRDLAAGDWAAENEIDADDRSVVERANYDQLQQDGGVEPYANNGYEAELNKNPEWVKKTKAMEDVKPVKKNTKLEEKKRREEKRKRDRKAKRMQKRKRKGKKGKGRKGKKGDKKIKKGKGKRRNKDKKRKDRKGKGRKRKPTANNNTPTANTNTHLVK